MPGDIAGRGRVDALYKDGHCDRGPIQEYGGGDGHNTDGVLTPTVSVTDTNPSHYFATKPTIKVTKYTNGEDADMPTGPIVAVGRTVTWTYRITNTGNVTLTNITLADDKIGDVTIELPGHHRWRWALSTLCTITGTAITGQYTNTAIVTGTPTLGPTTPVTDTNPSHYFAPRFSLGNQVFADTNNNGLKRRQRSRPRRRDRAPADQCGQRAEHHDHGQRRLLSLRWAARQRLPGRSRDAGRLPEQHRHRLFGNAQ